MSRAPGIGKGWIDKYTSDVYPKDYFYINGRKYPSNRYYDEQYKKKYPEEFALLKQKRKEKADKTPYQSEMRGYHKEKYRKNVTKNLERKIEL